LEELGSLLVEQRLYKKGIRLLTYFFLFLSSINVILLLGPLLDPGFNLYIKIIFSMVILYFEAVLIGLFISIRKPFKVYENGLNFSIWPHFNPLEDITIFHNDIELIVATDSSPFAKWLKIILKNGKSYTVGFDAIREGYNVIDNHEDIIKILKDKYSKRFREITFEEWARTKRGTYLDKIDLEPDLDYFAKLETSNMGIEQLEAELRELKRSPEYRKYIRYNTIAFIGLIMLFVGIIFLITNTTFNLTYRDFPLVTLFLTFCGMFLVFLGQFKSKLDYAIKMKILELKYQLIIQKKGWNIVDNKTNKE
jgi:hypothetical protein